MGSVAPTLSNLVEWLQRNATYDVAEESVPLVRSKVINVGPILCGGYFPRFDGLWDGAQGLLSLSTFSCPCVLHVTLIVCIHTLKQSDSDVNFHSPATIQ